MFEGLSRSYVNTDPSKMRDLDCNLVDISLALYKIFYKLETVKDQELVLVVGASKSGKSTALSYLAFGPDQLFLDKRKVKVNNKVMEREVIAQRTTLKEFEIFQIGYDDNKSRTVTPQFEYNSRMNLAFGDLVGLLEVHGDA